MAEIRSGIWGTCPWTISDDGVLTIGAGTGDDTHGYSPWNWFGDDVIEGITSVRTTGTVVLPANSSSLFLGFSNVESIDMSGFDTRNVTNMNYMFDGCYSLTSLDLSNFDTRSVTSMINMFQDCSSLSSLDMSNFDTSNVASMRRMFSNCSKLSSLDLSNFDTGKATDMSHVSFLIPLNFLLTLAALTENLLHYQKLQLFYQHMFFRVHDYTRLMASCFYHIPFGILPA